MRHPSTSLEFLEALKAHHRVRSDYALAQRMGWTQSAISNYRHLHSRFSAAHAVQVADALALPRAYVLASIEAERSPEPVAGVYREIALLFRAAAPPIRRASAILLIAGAALLAGSAPARAQSLRARVLDRSGVTCYTLCELLGIFGLALGFA